MLQELKVQNFAIIDNIQIQFESGLNIISGETGAGKSILLKSLGLLMGQKSSADTIRTGCESATVEGSFDLSDRTDIAEKLKEHDIEIFENQLVVRRVIQGDKSRVYLNGTLSTLNFLRDIVSPLITVAGHSAPLIEMTGQHENKNLLSTSYHMDILDQYCGAWDKRLVYQKKYSEWLSLQKELDTLKQEQNFKEQKLDFLNFQKKEIEQLKLQPGEETEIESKIKRIKSSHKLIQFIETAEQALYHDDDSAVARLKRVLAKSNDLSQLAPQLHEKTDSLNQAISLIDDYVFSARQYLKDSEADPSELENLESTLSHFRKLQKKYGNSVQEILNFLNQIQIEISELNQSEQRLQDLQNKIQKLQKELHEIATELHTQRKNYSLDLSKSVNLELEDLNMKGVRFLVQVESIQDLNSSGLSHVEFMCQSSAKDPFRSLAKVASGGELSRILLSLKKVTGSNAPANHLMSDKTNSDKTITEKAFSDKSSSDKSSSEKSNSEKNKLNKTAANKNLKSAKVNLMPRTYLFDEVDTGVSGNTAEKVGRKLKDIAEQQQVICVTHLPQVAAFGDYHLMIQKGPAKNDNGYITMDVAALKSKDRIHEIARLISGEKISKTSLAHAEQLLKEAQS